VLSHTGTVAHMASAWHCDPYGKVTSLQYCNKTVRKDNLYPTTIFTITHQRIGEQRTEGDPR